MEIFAVKVGVSWAVIKSRITILCFHKNTSAWQPHMAFKVMMKTSNGMSVVDGGPCFLP